MTTDYNCLANYIVKKYVDRISGIDIPDKIIGEDPAKRVMTGMLAENRMEVSFDGKYIENQETKYQSVPSISLSFIVKKNSNAILTIIPKGLLFYSVTTTYQEALEYVIKQYSAKNNKSYNSINEIIDENQNERTVAFPVSYKHIRLEKVFGDGIELDLNSERDSNNHISLEKSIEKKLRLLAEKVMPEIVIVEQLPLGFANLLNEKEFNKHCPYKTNESVYPRWNFDIICEVTDRDEETWNVSLQMVNKTPFENNTTKNRGYLPKIFDAGLEVSGNDSVEFVNIHLEYFKNSFKPHPDIYAIGENTSVEYNKLKNKIVTVNVPLYYQYRLKTNDSLNEYLTFNKLIENPIKYLNIIKDWINKDLCERDRECSSINTLTPDALKRLKLALNLYHQEVKRFERGIEQIESKDFVKKAFICMNKTFQVKLTNEQRSINGWRLFQIVFIVSLIPEVIISEYKDDVELSYADMDAANLLYFPTGGGKTEAFLGITVFDMFFDRFRGKNDGITAFLKYPLRLLTVQQLDRVLAIVMKANIIKETYPEIKNTTEFKVGFFVGKDNTPNNITVKEPLSSRGENGKFRNKILDADNETLNEYYRFIDTCPVCGKKMVNVSFNQDTWVLEHHCDNPECNVGVLPLHIVDNEIYRYLPSIVVCTVDKMATLGLTSDFKMLFGQVTSKCPIHGFSRNTRCKIPGCVSNDVNRIESLKDPIPTLFIQDELHLVKESLGTYDAHYESFIDNYAKNLVPKSQQKQICFIGATATISMYKEHIQHLYHKDARRFPCEYPSLMDDKRDFYSYIDRNDISRIILGYAPYGRSLTDGMWESIYLMRRIIYDLFRLSVVPQELINAGFNGTIDDFHEMIYNYWVELVYNTRKQDANEIYSGLQNQGNNLLKDYGVPLFNMKLMTSDVDFQSVRKTLFDIQSNKKNLENTNVLLATSTISHGVDEDAFNIMYFFGMPNNNAEYIQAYSRTGRRYTGIVIDIIRLLRIRDQSYLKNFILFHEHKDELVEAVPINRWAKNAIYSSLPGILSGILLQYYSNINCDENLNSTAKIKELLNSGVIDIDDVIKKVIDSYGCNNTEKLSDGYRSIISEEVRKILKDIKVNNMQKDVFLSDAISKSSHGNKGPMTSLRDTEEQLTIEVK